MSTIDSIHNAAAIDTFGADALPGPAATQDGAPAGTPGRRKSPAAADAPSATPPEPAAKASRRKGKAAKARPKPAEGPEFDAATVAEMEEAARDFFRWARKHVEAERAIDDFLASEAYHALKDEVIEEDRARARRLGREVQDEDEDDECPEGSTGQIRRSSSKNRYDNPHRAIESSGNNLMKVEWSRLNHADTEATWMLSEAEERIERVIKANATELPGRMELDVRENEITREFFRAGDFTFVPHATRAGDMKILDHRKAPAR